MYFRIGMRGRNLRARVEAEAVSVGEGVATVFLRRRLHAAVEAGVGVFAGRAWTPANAHSAHVHVGRRLLIRALTLPLLLTPTLLTTMTMIRRRRDGTLQQRKRWH